MRAVRAEPDGLTFAVPARLTIRPPAGGPARLVGMATANGGSGLQLLAAARTNTGEIVIPNVAHFSVVGVAVPSSTVELEAFFATSDFVSRVIDAHFSGGPEQALMEQWFDTEIRPLLQSGQTNNAALFKGIAQVYSWETNRTTAGSAAITYAAPIEARAAESRTLIANGLRAAIARHNGLCTTERSLNRAEEVMRFQALATSISDTITFAAVVPSFMPTAFPTLDLTGLTLASVVENLCVKVAILSTTFPGSGSLMPGVPENLNVNAGFAMKDGSAPLLSPSLQIRVDAIGATPRNA